MKKKRPDCEECVVQGGKNVYLAEGVGVVRNEVFGLERKYLCMGHRIRHEDLVDLFDWFAFKE